MDTRPRIIPRRGSTAIVSSRVTAKAAACGSQNIQDVIDRANQCMPPQAVGQGGTCAPPGAVPGYAAATALAAFGAAGTATATITPKAPFLGARLIIFCPTAADLALLTVSRVDVGLTRHVLSGAIPATEFGPLSANGGAFRLRAWAGPALPIEVYITASGATTGTTQVSFEGAFIAPGA